MGELVDGNPISIAEGYASGCSIFEGYSKNQAVVVAFDCHNLSNVIEKLRQTYPKSQITICGDDDVEADGNPGRSHAEEAAKKHQCNVLFPEFPKDFRLPNGKKPTDFNDIHVHFGLAEIKAQLAKNAQESPEKNNNIVISNEVKKSSTSLQLHSAYSLIQQPSKADWLIKPYLDLGSLALLFGDPGTMKSFLAIDMGCCIATGYDWHGMCVRKSGVVLYIAGEGFIGIPKRLLAWSIANHVNLEKIPFFASNRAVQFLNESSVTEIVDAVDELTAQHGLPILVIIDTLSRNFGPGDENQTEDMSRFVACIDKAIRLKYECTVLIIHHSPLNDNKRARGNSALNGAVDWEYRLSKEGDIRKLSSTKVKDYDHPQIICFKPKTILLDGWVDEDDGEIMTSCVLEKEDRDIVECKSNVAKLKGSQKIAFDCLLKLFASDSCEKSEGIHIDAWRDAAYKASISSSGNPEANKKAFQRAVKDLRNKEYIEANNDYWKPMRDTGQGRDI